MILALEAANPEDIPREWRGPVGGYPNHIPPWTEADFARFHEVYRISVRREAFYARGCRTIDRESGAALDQDVPGFVLEREAVGHEDATCYVDLSNWPGVRSELVAARISPARIRLHIADWTGEPHQLGPDVLGEGWTAWGVQYRNAGPFTETAVYGPAGFSRG